MEFFSLATKESVQIISRGTASDKKRQDDRFFQDQIVKTLPLV